jgi:hypothetical protein
MDTLDKYRQTIQNILLQHAKIPYAHGEIKNQTFFETQRDSYILLAIGWQKNRRIHHCLVHTDIINGKIWVQNDGTEYGIANKLIDAGIPKEKIVLGFHPPEIRIHTGFAVE